MTQKEAFYSFISSFGLKAYEEGPVPENGVSLPYITYDIPIFDRSEGSIYIRYRDNFDHKHTDETVKLISQAIGSEGVFLSFDGGGILIEKGAKFVQSVSSKQDGILRCRKINVIATVFSDDRKLVVSNEEESACIYCCDDLKISEEQVGKSVVTCDGGMSMDLIGSRRIIEAPDCRISAVDAIKLSGMLRSHPILTVSYPINGKTNSSLFLIEPMRFKTDALPQGGMRAASFKARSKEVFT